MILIIEDLKERGSIMFIGKTGFPFGITFLFNFKKVWLRIDLNNSKICLYVNDKKLE